MSNEKKKVKLPAREAEELGVSEGEDYSHIPDEDRLLTAEELLGPAALKRIEIPGLKKANAPGVVYLRDPSASRVLAFADAMSSGKGKKKKGLGILGGVDSEELFGLIADCIVHPDGKPMFNREQAKQLKDASIGVFLALASVFTGLADKLTGDLEGAETKKS